MANKEIIRYNENTNSVQINKRITCYIDEDGNPIPNDEVIKFHKLDSERCGWYSKDNTYFGECTTIKLSKEELQEYIEKIRK